MTANPEVITYHGSIDTISWNRNSFFFLFFFSRSPLFCILFAAPAQPGHAQVDFRLALSSKSVTSLFSCSQPLSHTHIDCNEPPTCIESLPPPLTVPTILQSTLSIRYLFFFLLPDLLVKNKRAINNDAFAFQTFRC